MDLNELIELKKVLENKLENYFGDEQKHSRDRGYQELLEELENIEEEIENLKN